MKIENEKKNRKQFLNMMPLKGCGKDERERERIETDLCIAVRIAGRATTLVLVFRGGNNSGGCWAAVLPFNRPAIQSSCRSLMGI